MTILIKNTAVNDAQLCYGYTVIHYKKNV